MSLNQLNILLADDDMEDCGFFKEALEGMMQPTQLNTVQDGEKLMQQLTNETNELPDVLFLDLYMPRKNGFECLEEIKSDSRLNHLVVIIVTNLKSNPLSLFEQDVANQLYRNGAQHLIRKPPEYSEFKKVIQQTVKLVALGDISQPTREKFVLTVQNNLAI